MQRSHIVHDWAKNTSVVKHHTIFHNNTAVSTNPPQLTWILSFTHIHTQILSLLQSYLQFSSTLIIKLNTPHHTVRQQQPKLHKPEHRITKDTIRYKYKYCTSFTWTHNLIVCITYRRARKRYCVCGQIKTNSIKFIRP